MMRKPDNLRPTPDGTIAKEKKRPARTEEPLIHWFACPQNQLEGNICPQSFSMHPTPETFVWWYWSLWMVPWKSCRTLSTWWSHCQNESHENGIIVPGMNHDKSFGRAFDDMVKFIFTISVASSPSLSSKSTVSSCAEKELVRVWPAVCCLIVTRNSSSVADAWNASNVGFPG